MTLLRLLASIIVLAIFAPSPSYAGDRYGGPDGGGRPHHDAGVRIDVPGLDRDRDRDRRRYDRRRYDDRRGCREIDPRRPWDRRRCVE